MTTTQKTYLNRLVKKALAGHDPRVEIAAKVLASEVEELEAKKIRRKFRRIKQQQQRDLLAVRRLSTTFHRCCSVGFVSSGSSSWRAVS